MAVGCGVSVATLYFCQPLLAIMASDVAGAQKLAAFIPTFTQVGTMVGMGVFVPLGDMLERRRLIVAVSLASAMFCIGTAVAPNGIWLAAVSLLLGLAGTVSHLILPFAAQLSSDEERGQVLGTVISGLLIGILCGRTVSGFVAASFGWRAVYWLGGAAMVVLAYLLGRKLPKSIPNADLSYPDLLRSIWGLARDSSILRQASLTGALLFAVFCAFWATLVFRLMTPPFHYGSRMAGLFGLVGVAGAAAAPLLGRFADRRGPRGTVQIGILTTAISFLVFLLAGNTMAGLVLGVILMDVGVQAGHVANQTRIYAINAEARSRLNTVYMVSYFIGGATGSALGAYAWKTAGWSGVCAVGLILMALALIVHRAGTSSEAAAAS
jgi:predicted MFS family arabinose efflux permease